MHLKPGQKSGVILLFLIQFFLVGWSQSGEIGGENSTDVGQAGVNRGGKSSSIKQLGDLLNAHRARKTLVTQELSLRRNHDPCKENQKTDAAHSSQKMILEKTLQYVEHQEGGLSPEEERLSEEVFRIFNLREFREKLVERFCEKISWEKAEKMDLSDSGDPSVIECLKKIHEASRGQIQEMADLFFKFDKAKIIKNFLTSGLHPVLNEDFFGGAVTRAVKSEFSKEYFKKWFLPSVASQLITDLNINLTQAQRVSFEADLGKAISLFGFNRAYVGKWASMNSDLDIKLYVQSEPFKDLLEKYAPSQRSRAEGRSPAVLEPSGTRSGPIYDALVTSTTSSLQSALKKNKASLEKIGLDLEVDTFSVMDDRRVDEALSGSTHENDRVFFTTVYRDNQFLAGSEKVASDFMDRVKTDLEKVSQGRDLESEILRRSHQAYLGERSFKPTHHRVLKAMSTLKTEKEALDKTESEAKTHILVNSSKQDWKFNLKADACRFSDHVGFLTTTHFLNTLCMFFQREKDRLNPKNPDYEHISRSEFNLLARDSRFIRGYSELTSEFCKIPQFAEGNEQACPLLVDTKVLRSDPQNHSYLFFAAVVEKLQEVSNQVNPDVNRALSKELKLKDKH